MGAIPRWPSCGGRGTAPTWSPRSTSRSSRSGGFPTTRGAASGRSDGGAAAGPSRRRRAADARRGRGARRQPELVPVRRGHRDGRDPLGRRTGADGVDGAGAGRRPGRRAARARPPLPPRLRADHGRRLRPLGRRLAAGRGRHLRVTRCGARCRWARRSATRGCSPPTSRRSRAAATAAAPARLLPSGDAYWLLDGTERELLVPDAGAPRAAVDVARLAGGGAGRRRDPRHLATVAAPVQIEPGAELSPAAREAVEAEAAALPLPGLERAIASTGAPRPGPRRRPAVGCG